MRKLACITLLLALAPTTLASTREISLPVRPDNSYLRQVLVNQVFTDDGETARVWEDEGGCNFLILSEPRLETGDGVVRLRSIAEARVGTRAGERCIVVTDWSGTVETTQTVVLEPGGETLRFDIVDSRVLEETVRAGLPLGRAWGWVKDYVHPRLRAVRIDLAPALGDLKSVLYLVLQGEHRGDVANSLDSIVPASVSVTDNGLLVELAMEVPWHPQRDRAVKPAETLSAAELARFESAWQAWDGFVAFVVKHFAAGAAAPESRRRLLEVLLEARYDLVRILAADPGRRGPDPVRSLFVDTWTRLAPVLRSLSPELPRERTLNLLSFVTAADALQTMDKLGPQIGLDISLDGLRRMARILAPETARDPVHYDDRVDPELRELFDFGPPLPLANPHNGQVRFGWPSLLPEARAAAIDGELVEKLNSWVPPAGELEAYLNSVHVLLNETGLRVAEASSLSPNLHEMYRVLVLATAWQETCWRQYRKIDGEVVPIRSPAGAVGLMQVVPNVWRGFYDPRGLSADIAYNAAAGGEILMHYLVNYAIKQQEDQQPGGTENLARATYAAYNGGPGHLRRYRSDHDNPRLRSIDLGFRTKFERVSGGDELAVRDCFTG